MHRQGTRGVWGPSSRRASALGLELGIEARLDRPPHAVLQLLAVFDAEARGRDRLAVVDVDAAALDPQGVRRRDARGAGDADRDDRNLRREREVEAAALELAELAPLAARSLRKDHDGLAPA